MNFKNLLRRDRVALDIPYCSDVKDSNLSDRSANFSHVILFKPSLFIAMAPSVVLHLHANISGVSLNTACTGQNLFSGQSRLSMVDHAQHWYIQRAVSGTSESAHKTVTGIAFASMLHSMATSYTIIFLPIPWAKLFVKLPLLTVSLTTDAWQTLTHLCSYVLKLLKIPQTFKLKIIRKRFLYHNSFSDLHSVPLIRFKHCPAIFRFIGDLWLVKCTSPTTIL